MDHIFHGKYMIHWNEPPTYLADEEILVFEDGLQEIIPAKIEALVHRAEDLIQERDYGLRSLREFKEKKTADEIVFYIMSLMIEIRYSEYALVQKWLRYWLRLREIAFHTKDMSRVQFEEGKISSEDVSRAKNFPIQDLYNGKLRKAGSRLTGRCPFHEEKTGSFTIFTDDNHFYCFGCHEHGTVLDYVMKTQKKNLRDAILSLL